MDSSCMALLSLTSLTSGVSHRADAPVAPDIRQDQQKADQSEHDNDTDDDKYHDPGSHVPVPFPAPGAEPQVRIPGKYSLTLIESSYSVRYREAAAGRSTDRPRQQQQPQEI